MGWGSGEGRINTRVGVCISVHWAYWNVCVCFFFCPRSSRSPCMGSYLWSTDSLNTFLFCIAAPPPSFYCSHPVLSYPPIFNRFLFSPIISFNFDSPGAYDKSCALQALFSHLHLILNRCFLHSFYSQCIRTFYYFPASYIPFTLHHYYIPIFPLTFPFPTFIIRFTHPWTKTQGTSSVLKSCPNPS